MCLDNLDYIPDLIDKIWTVEWNILAQSLKDYIEPTKLLEIVSKIKR